MEKPDLQTLEAGAQTVARRWPNIKPLIGLVLGSGWSQVIESFEIISQISYSEVACLGQPGVVGHPGLISLAEFKNQQLLIFQGRKHFYEGHGWTPVVFPAYLMAYYKVKQALITNAAGGVREDLEPGDLMLIEDHLNLLSGNPLIGVRSKLLPKAPFVDLSNAYDPELRKHLQLAAKSQKINLKTGIYAAMSGPNYETPAEVRMLRNLGADAVGMSTVPEVLFSVAAGIKVAAISCITNKAAGLSTEISHAEVLEVTAANQKKTAALLKVFLENIIN